MVKYILIAVLQVYDGNTLTIHEFNTKSACEEAQNLIAKQMQNNEDHVSYGYSINCIEDTISPTANQFYDVESNTKIKQSDDLPIHKSNDDLPIHKD